MGLMQAMFLVNDLKGCISFANVNQTHDTVGLGIDSELTRVIRPKACYLSVSRASHLVFTLSGGYTGGY